MPEALYEKLPPGPGRVASEVAAHQRARIHNAMIELVGEHGYAAVKMRDVVRLAGVSTRSFYENFEGKEDCFLRTHDLIVRGAVRRIGAAQADEIDWRQRPGLVFGAFAREIKIAPKAARLALVDAYDAGVESLEQAWRAESAFEAMMGGGLARGPDGFVVPPLIVEGIVAGVARLARLRLLAGQAENLNGFGDELTEWALSLLDQSAAELALLDKQSVSAEAEADEAPPLEGHRASIVAATAELAEVDGYAYLTTPRIRARAGISRAAFNAQFASVEDCFLAALELRAGEALDEATRAQGAGQTWAGGIYCALACLCERFGSDPLLVNLCLDDDFAPGSRGSAWRQRLVPAVADQIGGSTSSERLHKGLAGEASKSAIWELFHHSIVRSPTSEGPQIAATLAYLALAPMIGGSAAVAAIHGEQTT